MQNQGSVSEQLELEEGGSNHQPQELEQERDEFLMITPTKAQDREAAMNRLRMNTEDFQMQQEMEDRLVDGIPIPSKGLTYENDDVYRSKEIVHEIVATDSDTNDNGIHINPFAIEIEDDEEDEFDEAISRRYAFDQDEEFGATSNGYGGYRDANGDMFNDSRQPSPTNSMLSLMRSSSHPKNVIKMMKSFRRDQRRKRAERAFTATGFRGRVLLCMSSWCDITEKKGILLLLAFASIFTLLYELNSDTHARKIIFIIGVSALSLRLLYRPIYWLFWGRIIEQVCW